MTRNNNHNADDQSIQRIERALSNLGNEHTPPAGWEDRVLRGAIDAEERADKKDTGILGRAANMLMGVFNKLRHGKKDDPAAKPATPPAPRSKPE